MGLIYATAACGAGSGSSAADRTVVLATPTDLTNWDPAVGGDDLATLFFQTVFSPLLTVNVDLTVSPGIASVYSYNGTQTSLTLTIPAGQRFSDETPLDADAVKRNLDRTMKTKGGSATSLANITSVTVKSPTEVVIDLKAPDPGLLFALGRAPGMMVSPRAFGNAKITPVGSGPYVLDQHASTRGSRYVFARNPAYPHPERYGFDKVELRPMRDFNAMIAATTSKQVDVGGVAADGVEPAKAAGLTVKAMPSNVIGMWLVDRGGELAKPLADVRVRQAINHALDADGFIKAISKGGGTRTTQMFAVASQSYDASLDSRYPYDPARARQLLAEAGYPHGFELKMPSENAFEPAYYPIVQKQLAAVGIKVTYIPVAANQIADRYLGGEFPAFMWTYSPSDNWLDATYLLSKNGIYNPFHTDDRKVTGLLARIQKAPRAQQQPLFQQLNRYVVEQAWFAPLNIDPVYITWKPDKVKGTIGDKQMFIDLRDFQPLAG
nr:ABC transporter substrate-binding protein [Actinomadura rayongensis]